MQAESSDSYSEDVNIGVDLRAKSSVTDNFRLFPQNFDGFCSFQENNFACSSEILNKNPEICDKCSFWKIHPEAIQTNISLAYVNSLETNQYAVWKDIQILCGKCHI